MATKKSTSNTTAKTAADEVAQTAPEALHDDDTAAPEQLKIKDLLERVALATDLNKNKVRAIVEATLNELGKALEAGEGVNLPPLGKIRIVNARTEEQGSILTLKLRRMTPKSNDTSADKDALAEVGEDS